MPPQQASESRQVQTQALLDQADQGALPTLGEYTIRAGKRQALITVPTLLLENTAASVGDAATIYADFEAGLMLVALDDPATEQA